MIKSLYVISPSLMEPTIGFVNCEDILQDFGSEMCAQFLYISMETPDIGLVNTPLVDLPL
jgi:hypothetical protein